MIININKIIISTKNNIEKDDKKKNKNYFIIDMIIIKSITNYIKNNKNISKYYDYSFGNQIHSLDKILKAIIECIKYAKPYRSSDIASSTLHDHVKKLKNLGILKNTYKDLLSTYLIKTPSNKLKNRFTDTTFIVNKYGSEKIGYSGKHKRTGTKLSLDTDNNGIVLRDYIEAGNVYDSKIYYEQYDNDYFSDEVKKYNKTLIADAGYDSSFIKNKLTDDNLNYLIKYNKRNCKDEEKILKNKFNEEDFELYKTRFIIEKTNGSLKNIRKVQTRYDRKIEYFQISLYYSYIYHLIKYLIKN
jgi:hypothetical protein